jgi:tetratricopeptide (TPR) repeat protein
LSLALGLLLVGSPLRPALAADDFQRYLDAAVQLYENLEYERALTQVQRARGVARGVEQDVTLGLYEGILLAELGRWDEARASFETALLLDPSAKLPLSVAPKLETEFESIRQQVSATLARRKHGTGAVAAEANREQPASPAPESPRSEAPSVASTPAPSGPPSPEAGSDRPEQARPSRLSPPLPAPSVTPRVEASPHRVPVVPLALLGAGVVAGGLGAWFGVSANQRLGDARVEPFRDEALARFNEAHGSARTANVLWGTAGLAVVGAVVTWFLLPGHASASAPVSEEVTR